MSEKKISYLDRTFDDYRASLLNYVKTYYPHLSDSFDDATIGSWLIDLVASVGDNLIKLSSGDTIKAVFTAEETNKVLIQTSDGNIEIPVADIKEGSSVSKGTRIKNIKNSIINAKLQK